MKTLKLTLTSRWFDMIASGEKKEEYRELKMHWHRRLLNVKGDFYHFDIVEFINGYRKDARRMRVECKGIEVGVSKTKWSGCDAQACFVIKLGVVIDIQSGKS